MKLKPRSRAQPFERHREPPPLHVFQPGPAESPAASDTLTLIDSAGQEFPPGYAQRHADAERASTGPEVAFRDPGDFMVGPGGPGVPVYRAGEGFTPTDQLGAALAQPAAEDKPNPGDVGQLAADAIESCEQSAGTIERIADAVDKMAAELRIEATDTAQHFRDHGAAFGRIVQQFAQLAAEARATFKSERDRFKGEQAGRA